MNFVQLDQYYINIDQITYVERHKAGGGGAWINFAVGGESTETGGYIALDKDQADRFLAYLDSRDKGLYRIP